jgi:hypothetical protein
MTHRSQRDLLVSAIEEGIRQVEAHLDRNDPDREPQQIRLGLTYTDSVDVYVNGRRWEVFVRRPREESR